ncbi:MAG: HAD family hydrolase [Atopobiaceae bacterium]|nr:HAD family hydrolase [Atopobiaceae bacterium]
MSAIRLVAVDEDGTFLRDHAHYDVERFARVFDRMRAAGTRFVVATGNQCYQVMDLFADHWHDMGIVSANGAYVLDGREEVFAARATDAAVARMIEVCHQNPDIPFSLLGVNGAYVERGAPQEFFDDTARYCHRLFWVDDFSQVDDQVFMFSTVVPEPELDDAMALVGKAVDGSMEVVSSGEGYFDVVCPQVSKALGLRHLLERWRIDPKDCIAFGDSYNDMEMLKMVGCGYAMANAPTDIRQAADRVAPPCTEDGVLQVLEEIFGA